MSSIQKLTMDILRKDSRRFFVKVKRGLMWSDRILSIQNNIIMYFKIESKEGRFCQHIKNCILKSEENSNNESEHSVIISSLNNKFDDVKIRALTVSNHNSITLLIQEFEACKKSFEATSNQSAEQSNLIIPVSENMNKTINTQQSCVENLSNSSIYESCFNRPLSIEFDDTLHKSNTCEIKEHNQVNTTKLTRAYTTEAKVSDKLNETVSPKTSNRGNMPFLCMSIDKTLHDSAKIPLPEILKSLINEEEQDVINYGNSRLSSNRPGKSHLHFLFNFNKVGKESSKIEIEETRTGKKRNLAGVLVAILLITLYIVLTVNQLDILEWIEIAGCALSIGICLFEMRKANLVDEPFSYFPKPPDANALITVTSWVNEDSKDVFSTVAKVKFSKEYLKGLSYCEEQEGSSTFVYNTGNKENPEFKMKIKRLALKRRGFQIIAEFLEGDLFKLILIENAKYLTPQDSSKILNDLEKKSLCKLTTFIPLGIFAKKKIPSSILQSHIDSNNNLLSYLHVSDFSYIAKTGNPARQEVELTSDFEQLSYSIKSLLNKKTTIVSLSS